MLDDLHYSHRCVTSARDALEQVARDPSIQIVMAGMEMPTFDGFVLIEEARARIDQARPLAAVLMANKVTSDLAIRGMHVEAVDFLSKPIGFDAYSTALRRAMRYLGTRKALAHGGDISDVSQQIAKLVSALENQVVEAQPSEAVGEKEVAATLRMIIGSRSMRARFFPSQFFADPAWDILLDLTRAKLEGQQVSVSSVCIAASVPMSTALRWVRQMTEAGLLRRWTDPKDRRRDLIALTEQTAERMWDYLTTVHGMIRKI
jgi:CheY-like chemotaxis protein